METQKVRDRKIKREKFREKYWTADKRRIYGLVFRGVIFAALLLLFFTHRNFYTVTNEKGLQYYKKRMLGYPLAALLCVVLPFIRHKIRWPQWTEAVWKVLAIELIPIFSIVVCENVHGYTLYNYGFEDMFYTYVLVMSMFLIGYTLTNRVRASVFLVHILVVGFSVANYYVFSFRSEPILAADIFVMGTAMNVASSFKYTITYAIFVVIFSIPALYSLLIFLPGEEKSWHWKKRLIFAVCAVCVAANVFNTFAFSKYPKTRGINVKMFRPEKSYALHGQILTFVRSFYYTQVDKPEQYSVDFVEAIADRYSSDKVVKAETVSEKNPNVFIIMNEAFSDLESLGALESSEDCLSYIHSLKGQDNVIYGTLYTSVFGGHTATTEYEVLTGNPSAFLPASTVAYSLFVRKEQPAAVWDAADMGYAGLLAFHPYRASGYSRSRAYPMLGFSDFISLETIRDQLTDSDYLRDKVSDAYDFNYLISKYQETRAETDAPFYMFNVTMQNHSGYDADFDNFPQPITLGGAFAEEDEATRYINLIDKTDEAFEALTTYFESVDEPTVIVMFGDHEPGLSTSFYKKLYGRSPSSLENADRFVRYQTPLIIWANYDINAGGQHDEEFKDVSANYLSAKLTNLLGGPLTGYQKFMLEMSEELPVLTSHGCLTADGSYYSLTDEESPYYEKIAEYEALVYNNQFDDKKRLDTFFYLLQ